MSQAGGLRKIVVIGGTGGQGIPVVKELSAAGTYKAVVLTRDSKSERAQALGKLPNVEIFEGSQTDEAILHKVFEGAYGAFVNTDGFTIGEKREVFFGVRIFEIAVSKSVQHYIWGNLDYLTKLGNYQSQYRCGHYDGKARVAEWLLAQRKAVSTKVSILTSGPYLDMLFDGMFQPIKLEDGTFDFFAPLGKGSVPVIHLADLGYYARWMFDNPEKSDGLDLGVATENLKWQNLVDAFVKVTGQKAIYSDMAFFDRKKFPKDMPVHHAIGRASDFADPTGMSIHDNFSGISVVCIFVRFPAQDFGIAGKTTLLCAIMRCWIKFIPTEFAMWRNGLER